MNLIGDTSLSICKKKSKKYTPSTFCLLKFEIIAILMILSYVRYIALPNFGAPFS